MPLISRSLAFRSYCVDRALWHYVIAAEMYPLLYVFYVRGVLL